MSTDAALSYGTLDTQASTAGIESQAGVTTAMFELNRASFEPRPGAVSASYLASMRSYQTAGQRVTLRLGLQNPPSWVFSLPGSSYVDQNGDVSTEADFVFSQAVRSAAERYLSLVAAACRWRTSGPSGSPRAATAKCSTRPAAPTGPSPGPP
jgi:hypothetical protein